jgi:hypothetical protein
LVISELWFNFHILVSFPNIFLLLISIHSIPLVEDNTWYYFYPLNLLRLIFWPIIWHIPENVTRVLEKNGYSSIVGWSIPEMYFEFVCTIFQVFCFLVDLLPACFICY